MAPRFAPRTIPPLAANIKLKAINTFRLQQQLPLLINVSPAQITLTPAAPSSGVQNYIFLDGEYLSGPGSSGPSMSLENPNDEITVYFATSNGKTYLLDVAISGVANWFYCLWYGSNSYIPGPNGYIAAQQGHLLIPFIAGDAGVAINLRPKSCASNNQFLSAELTQAG
jgi:hypothetical protein